MRKQHICEYERHSTRSAKVLGGSYPLPIMPVTTCSPSSRPSYTRQSDDGVQMEGGDAQKAPLDHKTRHLYIDIPPNTHYTRRSGDPSTAECNSNKNSDGAMAGLRPVSRPRRHPGPDKYKCTGMSPNIFFPPPPNYMRCSALLGGRQHMPCGGALPTARLLSS